MLTGTAPSPSCAASSPSLSSSENDQLPPWPPLAFVALVPPAVADAAGGGRCVSSHTSIGRGPAVKPPTYSKYAGVSAAPRVTAPPPAGEAAASVGGTAARVRLAAFSTASRPLREAVSALSSAPPSATLARDASRRRERRSGAGAR